MSVLVFFDGNTMVLELQNLTNSVTNEPDTTATVTATLYDTGGDEVATDSDGWPVTLTHVSAGTYRKHLSHETDVTPGNNYKAVVDADGGSIVGHWEETVRAKVRTT